MSGSVPYGRKVVESAIQTVSTSGIKFTITPGGPIDILRVGIVITTATTGAVTNLKVERRPVAAAAANQVELAEFAVPILAVGKVSYFDLAARGAINPGEDVTVSSDGGSTAGAGVIFVEYLERPFVGTRIANATEAVAA